MTNTQTQLPPTMPRLTGRDICRGDYDGPNGTHCLAGWRDEVTHDYPGTTSIIHKALVRVLEAKPVDYTDDPAHSLDDCAAKWNAMPPLLGYIESPDKSHFILPAPTTGEEKQR